MSMPATEQVTTPPSPPPTPAVEDTRPANNNNRIKPRNIVLCFDGTTNTFNSSLTNLPVLFSLLSTDPNKQLCYYQSGVGTYEPSWTPSGIVKVVTRLLDSAFAWDLGQHVCDGYAYLMEHYRHGDHIYLLGFSRGAYTCRALAGMLQKVGLLLPGNGQSLSLAYKIYKSPSEWLVTPPCGNLSCTRCGERLSDAFKRSFSRNVTVHFVGVWDTVASVGAIIPRTLPFAQGGNANTHYRHALALDERRARFQPMLHRPQDAAPPATECTTPESGVRLKIKTQPQVIQENALPPSIKRMWFAGSHTNVGGGATRTNGDFSPRLSHIPLRWMLREAMLCGLDLKPKAVITSPLYTPFLSPDQRLSLVTDSPVVVAAASKKAKKGYFLPLDVDDAAYERFAPIARELVVFATQPSDRMDLEALAPRGDTLSFNISREKNATVMSRIKAIPGRFVHRLKTLAWWVLEVMPMVGLEWDSEGNTTKWNVMWHNGRGRVLPDGKDGVVVVLHESVLTRERACPSDFSNGDGVSVTERFYRHKAQFAPGDPSVAQYGH